MNKKTLLAVLLILCLSGTLACGRNDKTGDLGDTRQESNADDALAVYEVDMLEYKPEEIYMIGNVLELPEVADTQESFFCNLDANMKFGETFEGISALVCRDPVCGLTYYVNYGRDYFIYVLRDSESELAVPVPAKDLYCRNGELYFTAQTYGKYQLSGFSEGNVLKYNPKDGKVSVVIECAADNMVVYADGICYQEAGEERQIGGVYGKSIKNMFYMFGNEEKVQLPAKVGGIRRWNGCFMSYDREMLPYDESDPMIQQIIAMGYTPAGVAGGINSVVLIDESGNEQGRLDNLAGCPSAFIIDRGFIYYVATEDDDTYCLRRYDMNTELHEDIAVIGYPTDLGMDDMIVFNGIVYFGNGLRVELDSGKQCYMQCNDDGSVYIDNFFTDGETLFCVKNEKIWKFEEMKHVPAGSREFISGTALEIGTYVYNLTEP